MIFNHFIVVQIARVAAGQRPPASQHHPRDRLESPWLSLACSAPLPVNNPMPEVKARHGIFLFFSMGVGM